MKTSKRDLIIIAVIIVIAVSGFFIMRSVLNTPSNNPAIVQHWYQNKGGFNTTEDLVLIDFDNKEVKELNKQSNVPAEYGTFPIIDKSKNTITVLGEYIEPKSKKRQVLVVEYSFENRTVEIIDETSPQGICSNMGASVKMALICLPNQIKVIFESNDSNGGIDNEQ